ncbi:hypothetical protein U9M48_034677 [Paspalum notatum var. saurae]|uniref:Uncharacterized protein n=1 Tax=Paspalum notatum var. saurae TaxID=547442 RepID=A0AAQ3UAG4_PASNO
MKKFLLHSTTPTLVGGRRPLRRSGHRSAPPPIPQKIGRASKGKPGLVKRVGVLGSQNRVIVQTNNLETQKEGEGRTCVISSTEALLHVSNVQVVDSVRGHETKYLGDGTKVWYTRGTNASAILCCDTLARNSGEKKTETHIADSRVRDAVVLEVDFAQSRSWLFLMTTGTHLHLNAQAPAVSTEIPARPY